MRSLFCGEKDDGETPLYAIALLPDGKKAIAFS